MTISNSVQTNTAFSTFLSHEFAHFIVDQLGIRNVSVFENLAFDEAIGDTVATLLWDTQYTGLGHYLQGGRPWTYDIDYDVRLNENVYPSWCTIMANPALDAHCVGMPLSGAFWDLRKIIGDTATERILADFLFVTDGRLDDSIIVEVLTADDRDGNICVESASEHQSAILAAFGQHGWSDPCPLPTESTVAVQWLGPATPPSQAAGDFTVSYSQSAFPIVTLRTTQKDGTDVDRWTIGRIGPNGPLDIGVVRATWTGATNDITVQVGSDVNPNLRCRGVHIVDVTPQSATHWSGVSLQLTGDLFGRVQAYANQSGFGGRVGGTVAGRASRIIGQGIGEGAASTTAVQLVVNGAVTKASVDEIPGGSTLKIGVLKESVEINKTIIGDMNIESDLANSISIKGTGNSLGNITIAGSILVSGLPSATGEVAITGGMAGDILASGDILGYVTISGVFNGDICAGNLTASQPLPTNINLHFGPSATVCGQPPVCAGDSQCNDGSICTTDVCVNSRCVYRHNTTCKKNRYISFTPESGSTNVAYRVQKLTNAPNAGRCAVTGNVCTGPGQGNCAAGQTCISSYPAGNPGGSCWVQDPKQSSNPVPAQDDQYTAECGPDPVFRVWTEPVVHVGDCEIIPASTYEIYTNAPGPIENPTPLVIQTAWTPSLNYKLGGDIVGINNGTEWTVPNQFANVNDALAMLAIIASNGIRPHFTAANVRGPSASDGGCLNPNVNVADTQMITLSIAGASYGPPTTLQPVDPGACTCSSGMGGSGGGGGGGEGFAGGGEGFGPEGFTSTPTFALTVNPYEIDAEDTATVNVYLDAAQVIGAYEVSLDITGGTTGTVTPEAIAINTAQSDYAFYGHSVYQVTNVDSNMAGAVEANGGGALVIDDEYLAHWTFRASNDAYGVFEVRVSDERSFLLDESGILIAHDASALAYIRVGVECTSAIHCDDGNQCTSDACTSGACVNTNLSNGTACNDGLYCTLTDTCNGSGVCVGSAAKPCGKLNPVCCEATDTCHPTGYECELE